MADKEEPLPEGPRVHSRVAVDTASARGHAATSVNVYIKAGAALAGAAASGVVSVVDMEAALDALKAAEAAGATPEQALADVEARAPSVAEAIREQAGKPVTWAFLGFLIQFLRFFLDYT